MTATASVRRPADASLTRRIGRDRRARAVLWLGVLAPFIFTTIKSVEDVQAGVGALDALRGAGPALCWVLARLMQPHPPRVIPRSGVVIGAAWFLCAAAASTLWSVDQRGTALKCVPLIFTFVCLARLARMYPSFTDAVVGLFHVVHVILVGLMVQLVVVPSLAFSGSVADPIPRVHSVIPSIASNLLGLVIGAGLLGLLVSVGPRWALRPPVRLLLVCAYLVLLIGTRSRVVTVIALAAVLVAAVVAMHRSQITAAVGWFVIAGIVVVAGYVLADRQIVAAVEAFVLRGQDQRALSSLTGRTEVWDRALLLWQERPFQGFGYYSGHRIAIAERFARGRLYSNLDSTWIETLVDVGVVGLAGLAIFAVAGAAAVVRVEAAGRVRVAALLLVVACLVMSFVNPGIQDTTPTLMLFGIVVFGAAAVPPTR